MWAMDPSLTLPHQNSCVIVQGASATLPQLLCSAVHALVLQAVYLCRTSGPQDLQTSSCCQICCHTVCVGPTLARKFMDFHGSHRHLLPLPNLANQQGYNLCHQKAATSPQAQGLRCPANARNPSRTLLHKHEICDGKKCCAYVASALLGHKNQQEQMLCTNALILPAVADC